MDRRRALKGLKGEARRVASGLLDTWTGWDPAGLLTLRSYALSCERLEALQMAGAVDVKVLHRELRINQQLLKALNLEDDRR